MTLVTVSKFTALVLVASSCSADGARPATSGSGANPAPSASVAALRSPPVVPPEPASPSVAWDELSRRLKVTDGSARQRPLVYPPTPPCPLRYMTDAKAVMKNVGGGAEAEPEGQALYLDNELELSGASGDWQLKPVSWAIGLAAEAGRAPAAAGPLPAAARLTSRGATLEVTTEAFLWNGLGSFSGMALFFPKLPDPSPGSKTEWRPRWQTSGPPDVRDRIGRTFDETVNLQLESWIVVAGEPAVVVSGRSDRDIPDLIGAMRFEGQAIPGSNIGRSAMRGQWVVLASGRVLHARVERSTRMVLMFEDETSMTQDHRTSLELRLVAACDGPVLPRFDRAPPAAR